jgi:hypothetical protein
METQHLYRRRELTATIEAALGSLPVVVVTGLRQVGKSTLLQQEEALRERRYLTLDDFATLEVARERPGELLTGGSAGVTIDEAQRAPDLLLAIKREVDRARRPGRFLLSGSANFALLREVTESLAGRAIYLELLPFTERERRQALAEAPFLVRFLREGALPRDRGARLEPERVLRGGMPSVCLEQVKDPALWFRGFEQTYLERDVRALAQVADLIAFRRLLWLAAQRSARLLNVSELGREARLNHVTASRYLDLLEASYVVRRLPPYLDNAASRLIKSPKLYFTDAGIAAHLLGMERLEGHHRGALLETWVLQNLLGLLSPHGARVSFWCVQGRHEVDFVVQAGADVLAIEVKAASRYDEGDLSGLRAFLAAAPHCRAAILAYDGEVAWQVGERLFVVPLGLLLS